MSGCTSLSARLDEADALLREASYSSSLHRTSTYTLFQAMPRTGLVVKDGILTLVIEGDGYAWEDKYTPSTNPTPRDPVGLRLAIWTYPGSVYLARPCQYVSDPRCNVRAWTNDRFSMEALGAYVETLDQLKRAYQVSAFRLVGYSGGAYVALWLSTQRPDVREVVTVAGLLDPDSWTNMFDLSPLNHQGGFAKLVENRHTVSYTHFCGKKDKVIPCSEHRKLLESLSRQDRLNHTLYSVDGAAHGDIWKALKTASVATYPDAASW